MRLFVSSAPTERAFLTDRNWQTPWHREWVHGKVQPMDNSSGGFLGYAVMLVVAVLIGMMLAIGGAL